MTARGKGDEGAAVDLKDLAEVDLDAPVDWGRLADVLIEAEHTADLTKRAASITEARRLAGTSASALALVNTTLDRLSSAAE